ncbi:MAG: CHRD domain-containing protein [Acidobacteria bacterium]|nr:CHRD domain-containing protein [Acidobacteriota bacterium]
MSVCRALCPALLIWTIALVAPLAAQEQLDLSVRLTTIPVEPATAEGLTGFGSATASLDGDRLTVTGSFKDLQSPATSARLHAAPRGLRGPAILDLDVTSETSGTISGDVTLTPAQANRLRRGQIYLQLQSEEAPDGNLRGWLLP